MGEINMTPLIDVMLVLLVIFMVTAPFLVSAVKVTLPSAESRDDAPGPAPLVVVIDGESASSSEIFAGAIRDHGRGTLVGSRSFGKGSIQGIFPLEVGGVGLRLTTAKFFSPKGKAYSRVGVEPDLVVRSTARQPGDESTVAGLPASAIAGPVAPPAGDPALEAAIAASRRSIERQSSLPTGRAQPSGRARASR